MKRKVFLVLLAIIMSATSFVSLAGYENQADFIDEESIEWVESDNVSVESEETDIHIIKPGDPEAMSPEEFNNYYNKMGIMALAASPVGTLDAVNGDVIRGWLGIVIHQTQQLKFISM